jgi:hypothetical protein
MHGQYTTLKLSYDIFYDKIGKSKEKVASLYGVYMILLK